jgi:hypothetical protein
MSVRIVPEASEPREMTKWLSNTEFQAAAKRGEGLLMPGTVNDQIFQTN